MIAAVGAMIVGGFWLAVFLFIWISNAASRRRARPGDPPPHMISWIELVPLAAALIVATVVLDHVSPNLGDLVIGGLHVVALVVAAVTLRRM